LIFYYFLFFGFASKSKPSKELSPTSSLTFLAKDSTGLSEVNSESKLTALSSSPSLCFSGTKGGVIFLANNLSQSIGEKKE